MVENLIVSTSRGSSQTLQSPRLVAKVAQVVKMIKIGRTGNTKTRMKISPTMGKPTGTTSTGTTSTGRSTRRRIKKILSLMLMRRMLLSLPWISSLTS